MAREPITKHGRDHRPNGSDPINAIFFDYRNAGGYLDVTTTNYLSLVNNGDGGTIITDNGADGLALNSASSLALNNSGNGGISISQGVGSSGIYMLDNSGDGIHLDTGLGDGVIDLASNGAMTLHSVAGMTLSDQAAGIKIESTSTPSDYGSLGANSIELFAGDHTTFGNIVCAAFDSSHNVAFLNIGSYLVGGNAYNGAQFALTSPQEFAVITNGGAPLFEVRYDGSVHIKTGTSIVADL